MPTDQKNKKFQIIEGDSSQQEKKYEYQKKKNCYKHN